MKFDLDHTLMVTAAILSIVALIVAVNAMGDARFTALHGHRGQSTGIASPRPGGVGAADASSSGTALDRNRLSSAANASSLPTTTPRTAATAMAMGRIVGVRRGGPSDLPADVTWPDYPPLDVTATDTTDRPRATAQISGHLTNQWDEPIENAWVGAKPGHLDPATLQHPGGPARPLRGADLCVATNADGMFRFDQLIDGPHTVWAYAAHHLPAIATIDATPPVAPPLEPSLAPTIAADRMGVVIGTVTQRGSREPVKNFTVLVAYAGSLDEVRPDVPGQPGQAPARPVRVPDDLFLRTTPIWGDSLDPARQFFLYGFRTENGRFAAYTGVGAFDVYVFSENTARPMVRVNSTPNSVTEIAVELAPPTAISGRAVVADAPDRPVAGALVIANYTTNLAAGSARTDEDGRFFIVLPAGGTVRLKLAHLHFAEHDELVHVRDGETKEIVCRVAVGLVIEGKVTDADGVPVPEMTVRAGTYHSRGRMRQNSAVTDETGYYRVTGLVEGRYRFEVPTARGFLGHQQLVDVGPESATVDLVLNRGATAVFTCRIADGRVPEGLRVVLNRDPSSEPDPLPDTLDPNFRWSPAEPVYHATVPTDRATVEIKGIFPGHYFVLIRHPHLRNFQQTIELPSANETYHFVLDLDGGAAFSGRVQTITGDALPGVTVTCEPTTGDAGQIRAARSGVDGGFSIAGLEWRQYRVKAHLRDYLPFETTIDFSSGNPVEQIIELDAGFTLQGRVVDPSGQPVPQGWLYLDSPARGPYEGKPGTQIVLGEYRMSGLQPGDYAVTVAVPGFLPPENMRVRIASEITQFDIQLGQGGSLVGEVLAQANAPVAQAIVALVPRHPGPNSAPDHVEGALSMGGTPQTPRTVTNPQGRFTFVGLRPGPYRLQVRAFNYPPIERDVMIASSGETTVRIELTEGLSIAGIVRSADGQPFQAAVSAFLIAANDPLGESFAGTSANVSPQTGEFKLQGLIPGHYRLRVVDISSHAVLHDETRHVTENITGLTIDVTKPELVSVRGRLSSATGEPFTGVFLVLTAPDNPHYFRHAVTGLDGGFVFQQIVPGDYQLIARTPQGEALDPVWPITVGRAGVAGLTLQALRTVRGARVGSIQPNSPADRAGIRPGDLITTYNGREIRNAYDLAQAVLGASGRLGELIAVEILRDGIATTVYADPGDFGVVAR